MDDAPRRNRLADETSPYLLQHAANPVDWYPWGDEALALARQRDCPIFLSIGYSACHWCHVMAHESFEDAETAALMNRHFVNIKVDREERPDLDDIYMKAVLMLRGQGGWPMSVFLTPSLQPFFGGTYFPPQPRYGMPSFREVLGALAEAWDNQRDEVVSQGKQLTEAIAEEGRVDARGELPPDLLDASQQALSRAYEPQHGGFSPAPKFPHATDIRLMLRHHLRAGRREPLRMVEHTLTRMLRGGIHDQLGGGFHRYSTDAQWCIPHFEKMLYDNALLLPALLEAHLATGRQDFADCARGTCDWVLREMVTPGGGFASSQDADSEGQEGKYFAWTPAELTEVLGEPLAGEAARYFDVSEDGNFEHGTSALWMPRDDDAVARELGIDVPTLLSHMDQARRLLLAARARRVAPGTDDKVLVGWNGLMIGALAMADQVLGMPAARAAAQAAARYLLTDMAADDAGHLHATARGGRAHLRAGLDDYAFLAQGLLNLYEADFDPTWVRAARGLCGLVEREFRDAERGGYFTTDDSGQGLIARLKSSHDGALPAGAGVQALNLLRLAELSGDGGLHDAAMRAIADHAALLRRQPRAFSQLLMALDFALASPRAVVVAGPDDDAGAEALLATVRSSWLPQRVVARAAGGAVDPVLGVLAGRGDAPTARAYVCRGGTCAAPVDTPEALRAALSAG